MTPANTVVGLGEVLWDLLPSGRQLGGAPANFAYCSRLLGNRAVVASRIGNDDLGDEIRQRLQPAEVGCECLQIDAEHPTGTVKITLDSNGQPTYDIVQGVAWDFMEWSPKWESAAKSADAVCFGTLAQRSSKSRNTIHQFLDSTPKDSLRIFDVNLRQDFYSKQMIEASLRRADIVKLNREESVVLRGVLGLANNTSNDASFCRELIQKFELRCVCVTYGAEGSLLCDEFQERRHPGFKVAIKDTVGSGDAFTAGLVHGILSGQSLAEMNELANRMGAWVASCSGGMPRVPEAGLSQALMSLGQE
jgi:fructokinase